MKIGLLKEIKIGEGRVALTPNEVRKLTDHGHYVYVEKDAGLKAGFTDEDYSENGAWTDLVPAAVWDTDLVVKVKEPQPEEFRYFRPGLKLLSYLHLAANKPLEEALQLAGVMYTPLEDVEMNGRHPALDPMSIIAGRVATNLAIQGLWKGKGFLVGGALGTRTGTGVVVGGGIAGMASAREMLKHGMDVIVFDINPDTIARINRMVTHNGTIIAKMSRQACISNAIEVADIVIGAVLVPGAKAPHVLVPDMMAWMPEGGVMVDIAIDQGGCLKGIVPTSWDEPSYSRNGIEYFAIPNLPGSVPNTASIVLAEVVYPVVYEILK